MCTQKCRWSGGRRVHIRSIVDNNGASHSQAGVRVWRGEDKPLRWTLGDPAQGDLLTRLPASVPQLGARQHPSSPPGLPCDKEEAVIGSVNPIGAPLANHHSSPGISTAAVAAVMHERATCCTWVLCAPVWVSPAVVMIAAFSQHAVRPVW